MAERPTVAAMHELREQLREAEEELQGAEERADRHRREADQLRTLRHPEADALASCIRALDQLRNDRNVGPGTSATGYYGGGQADATERVLRHLAARYGVVWPEPEPPEPEPEPQPCPTCGIVGPHWSRAEHWPR